MHRFSQTDSFDCPHCGEVVRRGARQCRHCGASADCGWEETDGHLAEGGYTDEDDFDYDEFVEREFGVSATSSSEELKPLPFRLIVLAVVVALLLPLIVSLLAP